MSSPGLANWTGTFELSTFDDIRASGCVFPIEPASPIRTLARVPPSPRFPLPKLWAQRDLIIYPDEYAVFHDAIVTGTGAFIADGRIFTKDVFYPTGENSGRHPDNVALFLSEYNIRANGRSVTIEANLPIESKKGTHFLLMDNNRGNFWHFVHDILTKFYVMDRLPTSISSDMTVIRQKLKLEMQNFLLPHFLRERRSAAMRRGAMWRVERLIAPARANGLTGFSVNALEYVRKKLLALSDELACGDEGFQAGDRTPTYVSRRGARANQGRDIHNIDDREKMLSLYNFQTVFLEDIKPVDQIILMGRTLILLGIHGAGLANQFFLREGSKVIEITGSYKNASPQTPDSMARDSQIFGLGGYISSPYTVKDKIFVDTKHVHEIIRSLQA